MKSAFLGLGFLATLGCSAEGASQMAESIEERIKHDPPKTGSYLTSEGAKYDVSATGGATLTVQGPGDLCLRFWRKEKPVGEEGIVELAGQRCDNDTFGDLKWKAMYSYRVPDQLVIYPPGIFENPDLRPIQIKYVENQA